MKQIVTLEDLALHHTDTSIHEDAVEYVPMVKVVKDGKEEFEHCSDDLRLESLAQILAAWLVGAILLVSVFCGMLMIDDDDKNKEHRQRGARVTMRVKIKVKNGYRTRKIEYAF